MTSSKPRIVLLTGTSSGIGFSAALAFARAGDKVVATMRNPATAERLKAEGAGAAHPIECRTLDVTDAAAVASTVDAVLAEHGRIDVLVNNAGGGHSGTLEETPMAEIRGQMELNFFSVVSMIKAVLPAMRQQGSGRILTVSSMTGVVGLPFRDAYAASKFAVEGLVESLAPVAASFGVHLSLIEPGPVRTGFFTAMYEASSAPDAASPYAALQRAYEEASASRLAAGGQPPEELGALLLDISRAEKPQLRYQSSAMVTAWAGQKLVDPTGLSVLGALRGMLGQS